MRLQKLYRRRIVRESLYIYTRSTAVNQNQAGHPGQLAPSSNRSGKRSRTGTLAGCLFGLLLRSSLLLLALDILRVPVSET